MTILAALTPSALAPYFDSGTLARGFEYARTGRIIDPEITKLTTDTVIATAEARGSNGRDYGVHVYAELVDDRFWITTTCSCPVRVDCKHGVALATVISAAERPLPQTTAGAWQHQIGSIIAELDAADRHATRSGELLPLALQILLDEDRFHGRSRGPALALRPVRRSVQGGWVKSGADWTTLGRSTGRHGFRPEQVDAVLDLWSVLQASNPYYRSAVGAPGLVEFGHRLVPLLRRAVEAGAPLVAGPGLEAVGLLDAPLTPTLDVVRTDDGGHLLRLGVVHDGRSWRGEEVVPIGSPAHTVALLEDGHLLLASIDAVLPPALADLLHAGVDIAVPAGGVDALPDLLRRLGRTVELTSSDHSVELPAAIRPSLRLTVTWRSSTEATLRWSWRYDERSCALDATDTLDGLREHHVEREIRDRVPAVLLRTVRATGGDALALAVHDLPALRAVDDVEIVEETPPTFRESEVAPSITFEVTDEHADGATDWLDLAVTISVEDERIPLADVLAALTREEEFVVLPSGLYLRADRPEFDRLREVVAAAATLRDLGDDDRVSVGKHDLGVWAQLAELGVVDAQAAQWVHRARALSGLVDLPRPEPSGLSTTLRDYQREGFHWLAFLWQHQLGGILADDMGLGKTLQVLALAQYAVTTDGAGPFLVVAPTSVVSAWLGEAAQHTPGLRVRTVTRRADDVAAIAADADIVVTTYAVLRLAQESFAAVPWAGLVLDEAQQVKNHQSKTYAAVRQIETPFRLAVTGTPFENRLMELWSLLSITVPGIYPWPRAFTTQVVTPVEKGRDPEALARFRRRIRPFMLRRTKELVAADLPPKQEQVLDVELGSRHRKLYDTHLAKERQRILGLVEDFERNRVAIFSALTTLRRLALDPALIDPAHDRVGSAKLDVLVEHLTEITAEGHRSLVFSQFTSYLERVESRLTDAGFQTAYLDGRTRDRGAAVAEFRSGTAEVFLISLKAGGVGLTLTEADYVFVLDPWWNPAAEAQAVDRAHRIGQNRPVHVYRMIATGTIEEKVMELKVRKAELFAQVIDGEGASAAGITAADIRGLFDA